MSRDRRVDRETLCGLIPHSGQMCLLDYVEDWDDDWIVCGTTTHHNAGNPLRRAGHLSAVHAAEYGAQAMAVHGGLLQQQMQKKKGDLMRPGYLVSLRDVNIHVKYLDNIQGDIQVRANRLVESKNSLMYEFDVFSQDTKILNARATVMTESTSDL